MARFRRYCLIILWSGSTIPGVACLRHVPATGPITAPVAIRTYVDLRPGWRIRVVTPILRSGKYVPEFKETSPSAGPTELAAGDDFIGYETSYYRVLPGTQSGVSIEFMSSTLTLGGKETQKPRPVLQLFQMPKTARFVRLVFLTRVSDADHNQAILAAAELADLDRMTEEVESDPVTTCQSRESRYCEWVPEGIAVRAEKVDPANRKDWIPAS